MKWTKEEELILLNHFSSLDKVELSVKLNNRGWSAIRQKATKMSLSKRRKQFGDLSKLLNNTRQSFYWMGFLLADGHFSKTECVQVNLGMKDLGHLKKLASFVDYKKILNKPSLYIMDKKVVPEIKQRFKINSNKTYTPPVIDSIKGDDLTALIVGFIDGDGSFSNAKPGSYRMAIKVHSSWLELIQKMVDHVAEPGRYTAYINSEGLAFVSITSLEILKQLKKKAVKMRLPVLKRKWEIINMDYETKFQKSKRIRKECFSLFSNGQSARQVVDSTNFSRAVVYKNQSLFRTNKALTSH